MKNTRTIIAIISLLGWSATTVEAQRARSRKSTTAASRLQQRLTKSRYSSLSSNINRGKLNSLGTGRSRGLVTRAEQIRRQLGTQFRSNRDGYTGLLAPPPTIYSPISRMLNERNLLKSRSYLAKRSASVMGHQDYLYDENGHWRADTMRIKDSQQPAADSQHSPREVINFPNLLTQRLNEKAKDYYTMGLGYFRAKKYLLARHYFDQVRQLEPDLPRAYVAGLIVSFQRRDLNMAFMFLNRALEHTEKLSDLRVDIREFFPSKEDFQQVVDMANFMANTIVDSPSAHLLLAFYAWLNDDLNTAIDAAKMASEKLDRINQKVSNGANLRNPDRQKHIGPAQRFVELLIEARDNPVKKAIGD